MQKTRTIYPVEAGAKIKQAVSDRHASKKIRLMLYPSTTLCNILSGQALKDRFLLSVLRYLQIKRQICIPPPAITHWMVEKRTAVLCRGRLQPRTCGGSLSGIYRIHPFIHHKGILEEFLRRALQVLASVHGPSKVFKRMLE